MRKGVSRTFALPVLLALGAVLWSAPARSDERSEAKKAYQRGMSLIVKGKYEEGIEALQRAYDTLPHPNVLYNIGRAYVEMGEYEKAIGYFQRYLETEPADRQEVAEVVLRLQAMLERQKAMLAAAQKPEPQSGQAGPQSPALNPLPAQPKGAENQQKAQGAGQPAAGPERRFGSAKTENIYEETVVTASRGVQTPLDAPNSTSIITAQDIRLSGITKIPELLRRVAGVELMEITGSDSNVAIRGFNERLSNKLLVLVDGRSVYVDLFGATMWEMLSIDVDQIERIEVVRGPGSALYGADAFSGVVNIITVPPGEGRNQVRIGAGDNMQAYGSARVTGRSGDFAYRLSAGYTRYPRWSQSVRPERVDLKTSTNDQYIASENYRVDLRTSQRLGANTTLQLGGGFAQGANEFTGIGVFYDFVATQMRQSDVTATLNSKNFRTRVFFNRFDASGGMNANYVGQTLYNSSAVNNTLDVESEFFDTQKLGAQATNEFHLGANYRLKDVDWLIIGGHHQENHGALFAEDSVQPVRWMKFVASGRLDYNPYLDNLVFSPRGSLVLRPTERSALRFSASSAYKKPSFLESRASFPLQLPVTGADAYYGSDLFVHKGFKLQPEKVLALETGYLNQESEYFEWDLTAYYQHATDMINGAPFPLASPSDLANGNAGYDPATGRYTIAYGGLVNECAVRNIYGGEAGVRAYPVTGLDIFANYALVFNGDDIPAGCFAKQDKHTSRHKVNAGVQVRSKLGLDGELTFHYVSSQTWTELVASVGNTADVKYELKPVDDYMLVNARLGYRFMKNQAEVSATAFNLLNNRHQEHPIGQLVGRRFMGYVTYRF